MRSMLANLCALQVAIMSASAYNQGASEVHNPENAGAEASIKRSQTYPKKAHRTASQCVNRLWHPDQDPAKNPFAAFLSTKDCVAAAARIDVYIYIAGWRS